MNCEPAFVAAQDEVAQSERRISQNLVRVFKALGGGWQPSDLAVVSGPAGNSREKSFAGK